MWKFINDNKEYVIYTDNSMSFKNKKAHMEYVKPFSFKKKFFNKNVFLTDD